MSSTPNSKANGVRYFDSETLHKTIAMREVRAAQKCLDEAERLIASKPGMGQGTRAQVGELYCRLYQVGQRNVREARRELEIILASQILRHEPEVITLPDFPIRRGAQPGSTRPPERAA